jgi:hypothetical protein
MASPSIVARDDRQGNVDAESAEASGEYHHKTVEFVEESSASVQSIKVGII